MSADRLTRQLSGSHVSLLLLRLSDVSTVRRQMDCENVDRGDLLIVSDVSCCEILQLADSIASIS